MLILTKRQFWTAFFIVLAFLLALGVIAWLSLHGPAASGTAAPPATLKYIGENILFYALIFSGAVAFLGILLYRTAVSRLRAAENLMADKRWMQSPEDQWDRRLGELGTSFFRINRELLETNRRRGIKIQGMNSLLAFIVKNFEEPIFVVNAAGEVVYVSNEYLSFSGSTRSDLLGRNLNSLLTEVYFPQLISDFGRTPVMLERRSEGRNYSFYNIMDRRGEIAYVTVSPGNRQYQPPVEGPAENQSTLRVKRRRFPWIFGQEKQ